MSKRGGWFRFLGIFLSSLFSGDPEKYDINIFVFALLTFDCSANSSVVFSLAFLLSSSCRLQSGWKQKKMRGQRHRPKAPVAHLEQDINREAPRKNHSHRNA
jgi:hypothetical protein